MQTNVYTLPEISFVGGETQTISFYLKNQNGEPFDAAGSVSDFSFCNYSNKDGTPLKSYTPTLMAEGEHGVPCILSVTINGTDTANLSGKFVYQITIRDLEGKTEIPNQGIMNIARNIHQNFIQGSAQQ